ncbi:MAG: helix-turn-helix transcriptional regulator [Clostridia bacterium]|nr:helix-turn-helix transcriptional regulator [Clostridia bacterium]
MEFKFSQKLKELRAKKNITQEQLARHLQISPQAVSKWERNEGYPDIMLLPRIALYFDVTIDDLLGIEKERIKEQIKAWEDESYAYKAKGDVMANHALWEAAYAEYPNEVQVIYQYSRALWNVFMVDTKKKRAYGEKMVALGEELLEIATDQDTRNGVIQMLVYAYDELGDKEKPKKYAWMMGSFWTCREMLLSNIMDGDEGVESKQNFLHTLTHELNLKAFVLAQQYTDEERIKIYHTMFAIYNIVYPDGDYGFEAVHISNHYGALAYLYAKTGNREGALDALREAVRFALMFDRKENDGQQHTSLLFNKLTISYSGTKNYTGNTCTLRLKGLKSKVYDFLREDAEFMEIQKILEENAS